MVDFGPNAHPLADGMIVVARHVRQHRLAAGQLQRVEKFRSAKRLANNLCLYRPGVVVHDVVGAQQHVTFAAWVARRQRAFIKADQVAQRSTRHHADVLMHQCGRNKNAMANEVSHKARCRPVVERIGVFPLVQMAFVHHADAVADGKGFQLVVGHKQGRGARSLQYATHLMRQPFAQIDIEIGKRLVEQQQARPWRQRPRQRHALLLSARQFVGKPFVGSAHADQFQHLADTQVAGGSV